LKNPLLRRPPAAESIPITSLVAPSLLRYRAGHYGFTLRLGGCSYETVDDAAINGWHERLNLLLRNIASPHWAIWTHIIRDRAPAPREGDFPPGFARDVDRKYTRKLGAGSMMANELYASFVFRPQVSVVGSGVLKFLDRADETSADAEMTDSLDQCAKKQQEVLIALGRYDPELLGVYEFNGRRFSSLLEFYGRLVNAEWRRMGLPRAPLNEVLATSETHFGSEAMEYRMLTQTRLGAFLGIKEYPTPSGPGIFSRLLRAPYPLVLTQSFEFMAKEKAVKLMKARLRRMSAAEDPAVSQRGQLVLALDDLISNQFVLGRHHFSLQVLADPFDGVQEAATPARLKQLNDNLAHARDLLADTGMVVARETAGLKPAYWGQLPGNFAHCVARKSPTTSLNFVGMNPFLNDPTGREKGNHWGDALVTLQTSSGAPLHFSLHTIDPKTPDGGSRKDVGHAIGLGPTGGGKSTFLGFLIAQMTRFGATQIVFDKDEGLHILIRALGGEYLALRNGEPTGFNPLQLNPTPLNVEFMRQWLRRLVMRSADDRLTVREEADLEEALLQVISEDQSARRLSRLVEFLDITDAEGIHARLLPWCRGGARGWAFDNPVDRLVPLLDKAPLVGFDVTDFIDNPVIRPVLTMYLFHLVHRMVDGRRLVVWCDEFAKLLDDHAFADFAKNALEAWRKSNACFVGLTQMASHVTKSKIAASILEQCPTRFAWPNPAANFEEYTTGKGEDRGFGFSEREFTLISKTLEPGSRQLLIKQNHISVVAKPDLKGLDFELDVISGRKANIPLMHRAIATFGPEPEKWLPGFRSALATRSTTPLDFKNEETARA
jgi:type IV secretion system protein VirB4